MILSSSEAVESTFKHPKGLSSAGDLIGFLLNDDDPYYFRSDIAFEISQKINYLFLFSSFVT